MINLLLVEDSAVDEQLLLHLFESDPEIKVSAVVRDGAGVLQAVEKFRPDIVLMDQYLPKQNGLDATRQIMENIPTPVVIITGVDDTQEQANIFRAMEAGALGLLRKPTSLGSLKNDPAGREIIKTIKIMAEVKVVKRWSPGRFQGRSTSPPGPSTLSKPDRLEIVAIGASTGGPIILKNILMTLPATFPAPILVVQHLAKGFISGFAEWLNQGSAVHVKIATDREHIKPGNAYLAPDDFQMLVAPGGVIRLTTDLPENGERPAISCLMRSVAKSYGPNAIGVLLSGMGRDGAEELKQLKDCGATTIVQNRETCVVFGIPGEAVKLDAVTHTLAPDQIAMTLLQAGSVTSP